MYIYIVGFYIFTDGFYIKIITRYYKLWQVWIMLELQLRL
jgi:hypothetical protein